MTIKEIRLDYDDGELSKAQLYIYSPIGWWNGFITYNIGEVESSQNIRLKVEENPFSWKDFDADMLVNYGGIDSADEGPDYRYSHGMLMATIIESLNAARMRYLEYESRGVGWEYASNMAWEQIIALLPQSYIIGKELCLDRDDIYMILLYLKRNRHSDDLRAFVINHMKLKGQ